MSYQLPVTSYQLPVISYQLSVIHLEGVDDQVSTLGNRRANLVEIIFSFHGYSLLTTHYSLLTVNKKDKLN